MPKSGDSPKTKLVSSRKYRPFVQQKTCQLWDKMRHCIYPFFNRLMWFQNCRLTKAGKFSCFVCGV